MLQRFVPHLLSHLLSLAFVAAVFCAFSTKAQAQVKGDGPYVSEMREACIVELRKDARIQAECEQSYTDRYRQQDADQAARDQKHVIMAYAAILGLLTFFVVFLFKRQRNLSQEITRLEAELAQAIRE